MVLSRRGLLGKSILAGLSAFLIGIVGTAAAAPALATPPTIPAESRVTSLGYNASGSQTEKGSNLYAAALEDLRYVPRNSLSRAKTAVTAGALKVALWGDSITEGADQADPADAYAQRVQNALVRALPGVTLTFQNFGLGGRTIAQAADPGYTAAYPEGDISLHFFRDWSPIGGKSWRDYVKDFNPDLLVIAFGMNDAAGSGSDENEATRLQSILDYVNTWTPVPSVVIVPTFLPTRDATRYAQRQDITNAVARASREKAREKSLSIADANRLFQILRDGKDETRRSASFEQNWQGYSTLWAGDTAAFTLSGATLTPVGGATNKFVTRSRAFYNGTLQADVTFAAEGSGNLAWFNYRDSSDLGRMTVLVLPGATTGYLELYTNDSQTPLIGKYNLAIPTGVAQTVKIVADGRNHKVYLNGTLQITVDTYKKLHDGTVKMGGSNTVPTFANLKLTYSDPIQAGGVFSEDDLLGPYNDPIASGNGINHPSGQGHALFYLPAFNGVVAELARP